MVHDARTVLYGPMFIVWVQTPFLGTLLARISQQKDIIRLGINLWSENLIARRASVQY